MAEAAPTVHFGALGSCTVGSVGHLPREWLLRVRIDLLTLRRVCERCMRRCVGRSDTARSTFAQARLGQSGLPSRTS
eukprot:7022801-Pyramimonas_sp.AAC.2